MNSSLKSLVSLFSANIIVKVLGLGSIFVLTRFLTKEELSLIPNFTLISGLALVLANFGLTPVIIKTIPALLSEKNEKEAHSITYTCIVLIVPMLVLISIFIFIFSESVSVFLLESPDFSLHFKIIAASVTFTGLQNLFGYTYWSYDLLKKESKLHVIEGVVKVILNIGLVILYGSIGLVVSLAITQIISLSYAIYDLRHILFAPNKEFVNLKSLLKESLPFQLESFLMYFRAQGDQLVVTTFLGAETLAIYFVAKKVYDILQMFARSLDKVFTGSLAKQVGDVKKFSLKVSEIFQLNVFILVPFVSFCLGLTPFLITLIAGSEYDDAVPTSMLLTLCLLIQVFNSSTYGRSVFLLRSSMGRFKLTLINSAGLLVFSMIGIKFFSIEGVAMARILAELLTYFFGYLFIRKEVKVSFNTKHIIVVFAISLISAIILLIPQIYSTGFIAVIIGVASAVLFYLIAINRSISNSYYSFINSFLPFYLRDPLSMLMSKFSHR